MNRAKGGKAGSPFTCRPRGGALFPFVCTIKDIKDLPSSSVRQPVYMSRAVQIHYVCSFALCIRKSGERHGELQYVLGISLIMNFPASKGEAGTCTPHPSSMHPLFSLRSLQQTPDRPNAVKQERNRNGIYAPTGKLIPYLRRCRSCPLHSSQRASCCVVPLRRKYSRAADDPFRTAP